MVNTLGAHSRRDTLRVFGLPDMMNETLKGYVISNVLVHTLTRAQRTLCGHIGNLDADATENPRMFLIKPITLGQKNGGPYYRS